MKIAPLFHLEGEEKVSFIEKDNTDYLKKQVIKYSGRKFSLLNFIGEEVTLIKKKLSKNKLTILDGFSGTGIVSRMFKMHSSKLYVNDLEHYSKIINQCYLTNRNSVNLTVLNELVTQLNSLSINESNDLGFIEELYSPKNTHSIQVGERAFFTNENAKIIDNIRRDIDKIVEPKYKPLIIAPLLASLNGRANIMSVYRAFYKDTISNKGRWGGNNPKLIGKLFSRLIVEVPVLSDFNCESEIFCKDINTLVTELPEVDLAYFDPPYDKYAYGENFFMYNLIAKYERPSKLTKVAGVPLNWNRSAYNSKIGSKNAIENLIENTKAKYILFSYKDNGLLNIVELQGILERYGIVKTKSFEGTNSDNDIIFNLEKSN